RKHYMTVIASAVQRSRPLKAMKGSVPLRSMCCKLQIMAESMPTLLLRTPYYTSSAPAHLLRKPLPALLVRRHLCSPMVWHRRHCLLCSMALLITVVLSP
ncbi:MAG: hypothetical protein ACPIOQ_84695, partial [Promethearchaeia archaeon]